MNRYELNEPLMQFKLRYAFSNYNDTLNIFFSRLLVENQGKTYVHIRMNLEFF